MASHQFKVVGIWTVFRPYDKNELRGWEPCSNVPNVVGSNPSTIYWMDIFHIYCCKNCIVCLKRRKKEAGSVPFFKKKNELR